MQTYRTGLDATESSGVDLLEEIVSKLPKERKIYTTQALIFVMVSHYLIDKWSLSSSVRVLLERGAEKFLGNCKRTRAGKISKNTSGISQARSALSIDSLNLVWGFLLKELKSQDMLWHGHLVKTIDGCSELLKPIEQLRKDYPPTKNQFGESAYPAIQMTVLHDALTGLAEDVEISPLNGEKKSSELEQAHKIISRLLSNIILVADRGFGIFQIVRSAKNQGVEVVLRLKEGMSKRILGKVLEAGADEEMHWSPSRDELKSHPDWNKGESIKGRIITQRVIRKDGKEIFLTIFTTLGKDYSAADIIQLYGKRWEIEGEIRDLKKTIGLSEISARTPQMIEKEILAAIIAYNIVRATILAAAKAHGIEDPKRLSFKNAFIIVKETTWRLMEASSDKEREHILERALYWVAARENKKRDRPSYPRTVYKKSQTYPSKKKNTEGVWV